MTDPIIRSSDVSTWLQARDVPADNAVLALVVESVNGYVSGLPVVANLGDGQPVPGGVKLGAIMLAARMWRRRNSPNGVDALTENGAVYVARHDPDVSRLLQLDGNTPPAVG